MFARVFKRLRRITTPDVEFRTGASHSSISTSRDSWPTYFYFLLFAAALCPTICSTNTARAQRNDDPVDQALRSWVGQNIYFEHDRLLLIRRAPVQADIKIDDPQIISEATLAITNLAHAFDLKVEFGVANANLILVRANGIADKDGKASRTLLTELGFQEADVNVIRNSTQWLTGCGVYSWRDSRNQISSSIVAVDKALSQKKLKSCIVTGILFSFGLRVRSEEVLDFSSDYIPFALLARSIVVCDKEISTGIATYSGSIRDVYIACIARKLRSKF